MNSIGACTILISLAASLTGPSVPPPHKFELIRMEDPVKSAQGTYQVGWIRAFLPDDPCQVQMIPVEMNEPYTYWTQWGLKMQDVNFDGYLDIAATQHEGAKWGYLHWFLYDPKTRQFYTDDLTRKLSGLTVADFQANPQTERITITRFFGVARKEYTFRVVAGHLLFCGSRWKLADTEENDQESYHTRPDRWKEPRIFHTAITDVEFDDKIWLNHYGFPVDVGEKKLSPNGGYWFALEMKVDENLEADTWLWVYNERDYLIGIRVLQTDRRYRARANWINEKLLYLQWWWGRVLGGYLILDVESERILQKEFVHAGETAFVQFQEAKRNGLIPAEDHAQEDRQKEVQGLPK
jgi:hypothetical protein